MKRSVRIILPVLIFALLMLMLSACSLGQSAKLRSKAEAYLKTLPKMTGIPDSFSAPKQITDLNSKSTPILFSAHSDTFGDDFTVGVTRDGEVVTDSYYRLSLKEKAEKEVTALLSEVLGAKLPVLRVNLPMKHDPALSGRSFASLADFFAAGGPRPEIRLGTGEKTEVSEEEIDSLLKYLLGKNFFCRLLPYASDAVSFSISEEGIWRSRQNADVITQEPYQPAP